MTLPTQTMKRIPRIKAALLQGLTTDQIADICKVTEKTIDRDLRAFRQSGAFDDWLREEWMRLHAIIQEKDPSEAYRQLTRLLGKTIVARIEQKIDVREIKLSWEHKTEAKE